LEGGRDMLFRFMGIMPFGGFEFTCDCGTWQKFDKITTGEVRLQCRTCQRTLRIWQQTSHWHLDIENMSPVPTDIPGGEGAGATTQ